jgi:tartrate-resistant acid phosphatase type 5
MPIPVRWWLSILLLLAVSGVGPVRAQSEAPRPRVPPTVRFAVVGDYSASQATGDVANRIHSWNPDFIITTGDNNYPDGAAATIDANIGQYYHSDIYPYVGSYGPGASFNQFFPALGNHDWNTPNAQPYLNYFTLPSNERYYDFAAGPVHLFAIDTDTHEPDGITSTSTQAIWLQNRLAAAPEPWRLVYGHHPPYSSGGSNATLQWPYRQWGATAVLSGHVHVYERLLINGLVYFVDGLGGWSIGSFGPPIPGSQVRYNQDYGAMLGEASADSIVFQFISRQGLLIDSYTINAPALVGHVTWEGRPAPPDPANVLPITLTLRLGANTTSYPNQQTDARGVFTVPVGTLPGGAYTWWAKGPQYLATAGAVTLTGGPTTTVELGVQRAGDVTADNLVDIADFGVLRGSFGQACGGLGYDGRADFTGDCLVDIADFGFLRGNFGQAGPPP